LIIVLAVGKWFNCSGNLTKFIFFEWIQPLCHVVKMLIVSIINKKIASNCTGNEHLTSAFDPRKFFTATSGEKITDCKDRFKKRWADSDERKACG